MTDVPPFTPEEIQNFALRHGLTNLTPAHLERMRELADKVAAAGRAVPRMPSKFDEPAHVFRVHVE